MSNKHKLAILPVVQKDAASGWFDETRSSWEQVCARFKERFQDSDEKNTAQIQRLASRLASSTVSTVD